MVPNTEGCVFHNQGQFNTGYGGRPEGLALAGFIGVCLAVGLSGSGFTAVNFNRWYLALTPPPLTPSGWIFAPFAASAYVMIGIAAWLVWRQNQIARRRQRRAMLAWGGLLALNALWTPFFFGLHLVLPALIVMCGLLGLAVFTAVRFFAIGLRPALLLLPYIGLAAFGCYLNAGFWWLNQ